METPDSLASSALGMRVQTAELDVIADNLAHASIPGFRPKAQALTSFGETLATVSQSGQAQGVLRHTGVRTDLALAGRGYFAVATPDGVAYTRDGRFNPDGHGHLSDASGNLVLGSLGPLHFPAGARILEDGHVAAHGAMVDRLRLVDFDETPASDDGERLVPSGGAIPKRSAAAVRSGYLEDSGVDAITQMTALVATQRAFEADQKALQRSDESLRRVVTEVPVVRS